MMREACPICRKLERLRARYPTAARRYAERVAFHDCPPAGTARRLALLARWRKVPDGLCRILRRLWKPLAEGSGEHAGD